MSRFCMSHSYYSNFFLFYLDCTIVKVTKKLRKRRAETPVMTKKEEPDSSQYAQYCPRNLKIKEEPGLGNFQNLGSIPQQPYGHMTPNFRTSCNDSPDLATNVAQLLTQLQSAQHNLIGSSPQAAMHPSHSKYF